MSVQGHDMGEPPAIRAASGLAVQQLPITSTAISNTIGHILNTVTGLDTSTSGTPLILRSTSTHLPQEPLPQRGPLKRKIKRSP